MECRHTQSGSIIIALVVFAIALVLFPYWKAGIFHPVHMILFIIVVITLALFYSLSVEIKNNFAVYD